MGFCETIDKGNHEVNCIIGGLAPALHQDKERMATILLCNILGGPASNSVLGRVLREKHGWVYNVECSYTAYSDRGIVTIAFGCDKENLEKCERAIMRELKKIQDSELSPRALKAARQQLLGQNAIAMENGESQCLSMGKSLLSFGKVISEEEIVSRVEAITANEVRIAACKIFSDTNLNKLVYL